MPDIVFPDRFVWGTATAAHQIEGGNVNNDWWRFEHDPASGCAEVSGDACDSFHRYGEDIALVAGLGLSAYRFSLEWSRIEPEEGEFSLAALDHYRRMAATCHEHGITPVVTFHHFTHPAWLAAAGTWEAPHSVDRFARYCERAAAHLGDLIGLACTLNEPNVVATMGWRLGVFPPRVRDRARRNAVNDTLVAAHRRAVEAIRSGPGDVPVGLTLSMTDYQLQPGGEEWLERIRRPAEDVFLEATGGDDFIGVQTYTRMRVGPDGALAGEEGVPVTQMGYEYWPEALAGTVRRAWDKTGGVPVCGRLPRRGDRCPRLLLLEPVGQLRVGVGLRPDVRTGGGGPADLRPPAQAQCLVVRGCRPGQRPLMARHRTPEPPHPR